MFDSILVRLWVLLWIFAGVLLFVPQADADMGLLTFFTELIGRAGGDSEAINHAADPATVEGELRGRLATLERTQWVNTLLGSSFDRQFRPYDSLMKAHLTAAGVQFEPIIRNGQNGRNGRPAIRILPNRHSLLNSFAFEVRKKLGGCEVIYDPIELIRDRVSARAYARDQSGSPNGIILLPHDAVILATPLTRSTLHEVLHMRDDYLESEGLAPPLRGRIKGLGDGVYGMPLSELRAGVFNLWWEARALRKTLWRMGPIGFERYFQKGLAELGGVLAGAEDTLRAARQINKLPTTFGPWRVVHRSDGSNDSIDYEPQKNRIEAIVVSSSPWRDTLEFRMPLFETRNPKEPENYLYFNAALHRLKAEIQDYAGRIYRIGALYEQLRGSQNWNRRLAVVREIIRESQRSADGFRIYPTPCSPYLTNPSGPSGQG